VHGVEAVAGLGAGLEILQGIVIESTSSEQGDYLSANKEIITFSGREKGWKQGFACNQEHIIIAMLGEPYHGCQWVMHTKKFSGITLIFSALLEWHYGRERRGWGGFRV